MSLFDFENAYPSSNSEFSFGNSNEIYDKGKNIGKLIDDPTLAEIGKKYGKSGAQTALGNIPTPLPSFRKLVTQTATRGVFADVDNPIQHGVSTAAIRYYPKVKPQYASEATWRQISN